MHLGKRACLQVLLALIASLSGMSVAVEISSHGKITYVKNGWYAEGTAVHHSIAQITGCATLNKFVIDKLHLCHTKSHSL